MFCYAKPSLRLADIFRILANTHRTHRCDASLDTTDIFGVPMRKKQRKCLKTANHAGSLLPTQFFAYHSDEEWERSGYAVSITRTCFIHPARTS